MLANALVIMIKRQTNFINGWALDSFVVSMHERKDLIFQTFKLYKRMYH